MPQFCDFHFFSNIFTLYLSLSLKYSYSYTLTEKSNSTIIDVLQGHAKQQQKYMQSHVSVFITIDIGKNERSFTDQSSIRSFHL